MNTLIKFFLILTIFNITYCPITNKLYLKPSRIKGTEAKEILNNRLASFFINDISTGSNDSLAGDFLISSLAGIEDDKIYRRRDVESCATKIFLTGIAIDQPNINANRTKKATTPLLTSNPNSRLYPPLLCKIETIDELIDLD